MNVNADRAEACQCHDCTQARYKSSLQWQLDQVTANTPPPYELTERISPENITKWTVREASTAERAPEPRKFRHYPQPWKFAEEGYNGGPAVLDANGNVLVSLFWPTHPPEETGEAEQETYALGKAIAKLCESGSVGESPAPALRDPTKEELSSPLFNAIWAAIKGWDISRENNGRYSGPTGTDVCTILDAIERVAAPPEPQPNEEIKKELELLAYCGHRTELIDGAWSVSFYESCEKCSAWWYDINRAFKLGQAKVSTLEQALRKIKATSIVCDGRCRWGHAKAFTEITNICGAALSGESRQ